MHFGLNTPFFTQDPGYGDFSESYLVEKLQELGVEYLRVPIIWDRLVTIQNNQSIWNQNNVRQYKHIINAITKTKDIKILACLLHPPHQIAIDYFYDRSSISDRFVEFIQGCLTYFPEIEEWEIWNEPNASDFYLSVQDGDSHRPWTPSEFINDILIPGAETIRNAKSDAIICVAGLAENGIVGHDEKTPALSNRLPQDEFFNSLRSPGVHDHFYFIPEFGYEFFKSLKTIFEEHRLSSKLELFDAVAYHPYPYFRIHQKTDKNLLASSLELINNFNQMLDFSGIRDIQIWITEVGARSFDVSNRHVRDESIQAKFIQELPQQQELLQTIARLYWYKLIDRPFDLRQEKSFGILDHHGKPKKSFFDLKQLCHSSRQTLSVLRDSLFYGQKFDKDCLDPITWEIKASTQFGFATVSNDNNNRNIMLLSPGRHKQDFIDLNSKSALSVDDEFYINCELGYEIISSNIGFQLDFEVSDSISNESLFRLRLTTDKEIALQLISPRQEQFAAINSDYSFATVAALKGLQVEVLKNQVDIILNFNNKVLVKTFLLKAAVRASQVKVKLNFTKLSSMRGFIQLTSILMSTKPKKVFTQTSPLELVTPHEDWTFQLPRISQIHQDEWILRATQFKQKGYFVEIGGHDGVANSNTINLEHHFDWNGIIVEANPRWYKEICKNRSCITVNYAAFSEPGQELEFVDAGAVGGLMSHLQDDIHAGFRQQQIKTGSVIKVPSARGDEILARYSAPEYIEYMSVDTEGSELEVLKSIDFYQWKVALLTIEHGGQEDKRQDIWEHMKVYGYERIRVWFEDWYYHISHLAKILDIDEEKARFCIEKTNTFIPYQRRTNLIKLGLAARKEGRFNDALNFFLEVTKDYYPDNIHAYIEAATEYQRQKQFQKVVDILNEAGKKIPNHPGLLRTSAIIFAQQRRYVLLTRVLDRILKQYQGMIHEQKISDIIINHKEELIRISHENPLLKEQNSNIAQHLTNLVLT
jgi:FkbM family methyltransferase